MCLASYSVGMTLALDDGLPALVAREVSKTFRMPEQQVHTLKERALHPLRRIHYHSFDALKGVSFAVSRGEFLEQRDPGLRQRMADSGAPQGFEDVVATLNPIADDQPDLPAHWGVTFAVDDADATAHTAAELGGRVDVPPFDAPWVRMTVITDPQGATFTASKFVPENRDLGSQSGSTAAAA